MTWPHPFAASTPGRCVLKFGRCRPTTPTPTARCAGEVLDVGDGRFFSNSYEREARLTTSELWRDWCTEKREHCIIGTFAEKALIGAMMITRQGAASSPVVEWEATWLDPLFRGHKVGKAGYERVTQWSLDHGFSFAAVFIRADNQRSQDIRAHQGFAYAYTVPGETWADGSVADTNAYVMGLRASTPAERRQLALDHMEEILAFLDQGPHAAPTPKDRLDVLTHPTRLQPGFNQQRFG